MASSKEISAMLSIVLLLACKSEAVDTGPEPELLFDEVCDDALDNDGDGSVDCLDSDCAEDPACQEDCADGLDNDLDGNLDCLDSDCVDASVCLEQLHCADGLDNDVDGAVDCEDQDCAEQCPEQDCGNGVDDDWDGLVDCEDLDCSGLEDCVEAGRCSDGLDNELDGLVDCQDPECAAESVCLEQDNCFDLVDNDLDGRSDCSDSDCESQCPERKCSDGVDNDLDGLPDCQDDDCEDKCSELDCGDGLDNDYDGGTDCGDLDCSGLGDCVELGHCKDLVDNDLNGFTDCADPVCNSQAQCDEYNACFDGADNDGDGLVDCEDGDCTTHCTESLCSDGIDNDFDGIIDCEDEDCIGSSSCVGWTWLSLNGGTAEVADKSRTGASSGSSVDQWVADIAYASGSVVLQESSGTYTCGWTATRLGLYWYKSPFSWSGGMSVSGLSTTGACSGRFTSSALTIYDGTFVSTSSVEFFPSFALPSQVYVNRSLFMNGVISSSWISGTRSSRYYGVSLSPASPFIHSF
jgi:hypothetical protein